jgi:hypothetical protein
MKRMFTVRLLACLVAMVIVGLSTHRLQAQAQPPPDHPSVTVRGQTYTPRMILARNMGTPEDQTTAFPPHKISEAMFRAILAEQQR